MPRNNAFRKSYELQYGLQIVSRTVTGNVNANKCRFCASFGRTKVSDGRVTKTNRSRKDEMIFITKFCTAMFAHHYNIIHDQHWSKNKDQISIWWWKIKLFYNFCPICRNHSIFFECSDKTVVGISTSVIDNMVKPFSISDTSDSAFWNTVLNLIERSDGDLYEISISKMTK